MLIRFCGLFLCILCQLSGAIRVDIYHAVKKKEYDELGKLLSKTSVSVEELEELAKEEDSKPLLYAAKATRKAQNLGIHEGNFLQAVLYIETHLAHFPEEGDHYLPKSKTGLGYDLEYDPVTKAHFIILSGKKALIGTGKQKIVTKAIFYNHKMPKVVARAEQSHPMHDELKITKMLRGQEGIFETLGFGSHDKFSTIYSKLYTPGSLETAFVQEHKLSLYEKVKVALNILKGLEAIHKKDIVHRDLGARNYLIDIPKGKPGKRDVVACIADLGRATFIDHAAHTKVQGNTTYTSPEGIFLSKMKGKDYPKADVFAVGCVFYRLIHGERGSWQDSQYVKEMHVPEKMRYHALMHHLLADTKSRRTILAKKSRSNKEEFEYIMLRMLEPYPTKRESAHSARVKMEKLFNKIK